MTKLFILIFLFVSSLSFSQTVFFRITSNNESAAQLLKTNLIIESIERDFSIGLDKQSSDWAFEIEIVKISNEMMLAYIIYLDLSEFHVFKQKFMFHSWITFFNENYSRPAKFFFDSFEDMIISLHQ